MKLSDKNLFYRCSKNGLFLPASGSDKEEQPSPAAGQIDLSETPSVCLSPDRKTLCAAAFPGNPFLNRTRLKQRSGRTEHRSIYLPG